MTYEDVCNEMHKTPAAVKQFVAKQSCFMGFIKPLSIEISCWSVEVSFQHKFFQKRQAFGEIVFINFFCQKF